MEVLSREIPAANVERLRDEVAELNKRARKLGVTPLVVFETARRVEKRKSDFGVEYDFVWATVEVHGESPKLNGWSLVACISPLEDTGKNLVKCVPGVECPIEFRDVEMTRCDHCHTARKRTDVFVVRHDSGEYKVVGRTCIADFLGHISVDGLLSAFSFLTLAGDLLGGADEEGWGFGGRVEYSFPIELFIGTTSLFVRRFGWTPRSAAKYGDVRATADEVWDFLMPARNGTDREDKRRFAEKFDLHASDADKELAVKALEWVRSLPENPASDYLYNLRVSCLLEYVMHKTAGLVASAVAAYKRHVEAEELKRREKLEKRRGHVGVKGKRSAFPKLTVLKIRHVEGYYGVKTLVAFENEVGDLLKWWASGDVSKDYLVGETYDITATVKDHGEYNGVNETNLTRVSKTAAPKVKGGKRKAKAKPDVAPAVEEKPIEAPVPAPAPSSGYGKQVMAKVVEAALYDPQWAAEAALRIGNLNYANQDFDILQHAEQLIRDGKAAAENPPPPPAPPKRRPGNFSNDKFDSFTIEPETNHVGFGTGCFAVYGHGTYGRGSVLAGRAKRAFLKGDYESVEAALVDFPEATAQDYSSKIDGYNSGDLLGPNPESWFDPAIAGEHWDNDY